MRLYCTCTKVQVRFIDKIPQHRFSHGVMSVIADADHRVRRMRDVELGGALAFDDRTSLGIYGAALLHQRFVVCRLGLIHDDIRAAGRELERNAQEFL